MMNSRINMETKESLLTPKALQMSMTAPRCPPYYTAQRSLLVGRRPHPEKHPYISLNTDQSGNKQEKHLMDRYIFQSTKAKANRIKAARKQKATSPFHKSPFHLPSSHPHLSSLGPDGSTQMTRLLGTVLPVTWQNGCRDSGGFRWIADSFVKTSIPLAALSHPVAARQFVKLTQSCQRLQYGKSGGEAKHCDVQFIDVFFPEEEVTVTPSGNSPKQRLVFFRGMVLFVHGGAWGSGSPWFYRLVAVPFLELGLAVAVVGYRVYPLSKTVAEQVEDLQAAWKVLKKEYSEWCCPRANGKDTSHLGTIVMGHSSGAHIALLWMVERAMQLRKTTKNEGNSKQTMSITSFVGISGPYNIDHHFDFEAARGVEEISPMKAANGFSRVEFLRNSPAWRLQDSLKDFDEGNGCCLQDCFPRHCLLIHGIEDDTVPFTATSEAFRVLKACGIEQCQERYVPETGHQDAVVHLMLGGRVRDDIVQWLVENYHVENRAEFISSKL